MAPPLPKLVPLFVADPFAPYVMARPADNTRRVPSRPWWVARSKDLWQREGVVEADWLALSAFASGFLVRNERGVQLLRLSTAEVVVEQDRAERAGLPRIVGVLAIIDDRFPRAKVAMAVQGAVWQRGCCLWSPVGAWAPVGYRVVTEADRELVLRERGLWVEPEPAPATSVDVAEDGDTPILAGLGTETLQDVARVFHGGFQPPVASESVPAQELLNGIERQEARAAAHADVVDGASSLAEVDLA